MAAHIFIKIEENRKVAQLSALEAPEGTTFITPLENHRLGKVNPTVSGVQLYVRARMQNTAHHLYRLYENLQAPHAG